jgi:hypothetical protein
VQDGACTWNEHKIRFDNERLRSPCDMFFFGMIQNRLRGFEALPEAIDDDCEIDDLETYGVDWDDLNNHDILAYHAEHNDNAQANLDFLNLKLIR